MLDLVMTLGWKIKKNDQNVVEEFCNEIAVKRCVFKVWMYNKRHTHGDDDDDKMYVYEFL